jgi:hypothetical protein
MPMTTLYLDNQTRTKTDESNKMTSIFKQPVSLLFIKANTFELLKDFEYHVGQFPSDDIIVVPTGFTTDLASIPRLLWFIFPPTGSYGKAAIIHDYLIVENKRTRKECDDIFLEAMKVDDVGFFTRNIIYLGVRFYNTIILQLSKMLHLLAHAF